MNMNGIEYSLPEVILLQESGIGTAEYAARTCYDSFENSENDDVEYLNILLEEGRGNEKNIIDPLIEGVNEIESSELLDSLAWVHHHHSIIEHTNLSYLIQGTSRGTLQEHARHRLQAISVRSTRYTMQEILNIFCASRVGDNTGPYFFKKKIKELNMFVLKGEMLDLEIEQMYDKLYRHYSIIGYEEFYKLALSKDAQEKRFSKELWQKEELLEALNNSKKKRNVGDAFKYIVTDNWKVDMVVTFNLRSLKNYFELRDSGAAYFQIQWLAKAMKEVTPKKYLRLIDKDYK